LPGPLLMSANVLLTEAMSLELGAGEPWPQDVQLFQPLDYDQVLLPDNACCLAVQAFLHMADLGFTVEMRPNAEAMSPSGRLPFIKAGNFIVAELDPIVSFVNTKGISLTAHLDASEKADMRAYMSLVTNVLGNAELYVSWLDDRTRREVTEERHGKHHPWPLDLVLTWLKRRTVTKRLHALQWAAKSLEEVYSEVDTCCKALAERLSNSQFFFGARPTELDALVFGHLFAILTTPLPDNKLQSIVSKYSNLVKLCENIESDYFVARVESDNGNFVKLP